MSTIVTRAGKGAPLTHVEVDANFTNLNSDKTEGTVGTAPNHIPLNQYLGKLAFMEYLPINTTGTFAPTLASATTISPTKTINFVSGTTAIATITVPSILVGGGQITLIPTGIFTTTTAGNIALASTAVVSKALIMTYDSVTNKWYPSY